MELNLHSLIYPIQAEKTNKKDWATKKINNKKSLIYSSPLLSFLRLTEAGRRGRKKEEQKTEAKGEDKRERREEAKKEAIMKKKSNEEKQKTEEKGGRGDFRK